jgi:hypothetical protein
MPALASGCPVGSGRAEAGILRLGRAQLGAGSPLMLMYAMARKSQGAEANASYSTRRLGAHSICLCTSR